MKPVSILAAGAPVALAAVLAGPALAASPKVSVRVEGTSRTLLRSTTVTVPSHGSITKGGAPSGGCPAAGGAGALNVATHGRWNGKYSSGLGIEVTNILGETDVYAKGHYWEIFVNDRAASVGVCDQKLKAGDQLLFAAVSAKGSEYPIVLKAPAKARAGSSFTVRAFYYPGKSSATKPLAGVKLTGAKGTTNSRGIATVTASKAGKLSLVGSKTGEIRSAATTVAVSK